MAGIALRCLFMKEISDRLLLRCEFRLAGEQRIELPGSTGYLGGCAS
jgi:hypothetical protein